jgi:hypothetical protein
MAGGLEKLITEDDKAQWTQGDINTWCFESYQIAKYVIYGVQDAGTSRFFNETGTTNYWGSTSGFAPGSQDNTDTPLPAYYYSKMRTIADQQLERAGIRLAYVLNQILTTKITKN